MKKILAIGGAVIKTATEPLKKIISLGDVEMLIYNGGAFFHDFQNAIEDMKGKTSHPLENLIESFACNKQASDEIWRWFEEGHAPAGSVAALCESKNIPILIFTALGCDFWQMFGYDWTIYARKAQEYFTILTERFKYKFHFINMGSAVIHPEIFIKVLSINRPSEFCADVVDFLDMYRPRTRVSKYGTYYQMSHEKFFQQWIQNLKRS